MKPSFKKTEHKSPIFLVFDNSHYIARLNHLIDSNAYLGHWAFRRLRYNTGDGLLRLMDRVGIDKACVSSASAIMYKNSQAGNEELRDEIEGREDRLIPFAVLSPAYAGWRRDLKWCREVLGAKGLRLYPGYHGYTLDDACCHELVRAATELGMVVSIPVMAHDLRQQHWLVDAPPVSCDAIAQLASAHPQARFIVLQGGSLSGSALVANADELPDNYWIEMSCMDSFYGGQLQQVKDRLGAHRLVFGTGICFRYPEPAFVRMEGLEATDAERAGIFGGNMSALLEAGGRPDAR